MTKANCERCHKSRWTRRKKRGEDYRHICKRCRCKAGMDCGAPKRAKLHIRRIKAKRAKPTKGTKKGNGRE